MSERRCHYGIGREKDYLLKEAIRSQFNKVKRQALNAETKAALDEYEEMKKNPVNYKRYVSFDELLGE